jgi:hypothetical protein
MARLRGARKSVPLVCALAVAACGGEADRPSAPEGPSPLAQRCSLRPADGDSGFPEGVLVDGSVVIGHGRALAPGELVDVFQQLQRNAANAGLMVSDSELETFDAEIELVTSEGEVELLLRSARHCVRATDIRVAG